MSIAMLMLIGLVVVPSAHAFLTRPALLVAKGRVSRASVATSAGNDAVEEYKFESNVSRVMDIIINSLYSNKDVFLRELISNAADACDKKRFLSLTDGSKGADNLGIRVYANREANTLTIEDRGIGMNKQDLIQNLGRIAESGTKKFMESMGKNKDAVSLIGQFGVGFYSGFLVADKMTVVTKGSSGEQLKWEALADTLDQYTITKDTSDPIESTGTRITLQLKDESDQYLDDVALKALIERYSEFIPFPIELLRNVTKPEEVPDMSKGPDETGAIPMKTVMQKVPEWSVVNNKKPLWLRPVKDCTEADYTEFYKQTFNAYDVPVAHAHFNVEGNVDFKALLYLPSEVPYELSRDMFAASARSLRLYVKRVFINDKFEDLIPRWLLFIRGVVDSEDLPLNVGREILQQSRALRIIKQRLVKKSIDMMTDLANTNETQYNAFWKNFGKYIKVGIIEDDKSRDELVPLCRFFSSKSDNDLVSLPQYVARMPEDQKQIYYAVGETRAQAAMSPAIEKIKQKGYEVLYVSEPIDEMTLQNIEKFNDKMITDIGRESSDDLSDDEKKKKEKSNNDYEDLRNYIKKVLGDKITRVECSTRLIDSPATIVQSEFGVSPNMQKYLRAQAVVDSDNKGEFANIFNQAVLEINPEHPIIARLKYLQENLENKEEEATETVSLIFNTAALAAGYVLDNAAEYSANVVKMMARLAKANQ
jgi:heat shock protein beta